VGYSFIAFFETDREQIVAFLTEDMIYSCKGIGTGSEKDREQIVAFLTEDNTCSCKGIETVSEKDREQIDTSLQKVEYLFL